MVLAHAARGKRKERQPKKQVQVRPEDAAANFRSGLKEMVVIVPIDAEIDKA